MQLAIADRECSAVAFGVKAPVFVTNGGVAVGKPAAVYDAEGGVYVDGTAVGMESAKGVCCVVEKDGAKDI